MRIIILAALQSTPQGMQKGNSSGIIVAVVGQLTDTCTDLYAHMPLPLATSPAHVRPGPPPPWEAGT